MIAYSSLNTPLHAQLKSIQLTPLVFQFIEKNDVNLPIKK